MKKKILIPIVLLLLIIAVLFVPVPKAVYEDGGTREYVALTYKIVDWNKIFADGVYEKTRIYFGSDRVKSIDELWENEYQNVRQTFVGEIININGFSIGVEPLDEQPERLSSDYIVFDTTNLAPLDVFRGDIVEVTFTGGIMESYPARINAVQWKLKTDFRQLEYTEKWLDKTDEIKKSDDYNHIFENIIITRIYSDCFIARPVIPSPNLIKVNAKLSDDWCEGDQVSCTCQNIYYDSASQRIEGDMLTIEQSNWQPDPNVCYKPVIYLYPDKKTDVNVNLELNGKLTCTYPKYKDGWKVTALPDGTLTDADGKVYNYLYWEGDTYANYDLTKGFCIKGEDTAKFLEIALEKLGLTRREANEFIVYWLPLMQDNPYNIISFQTDAYTDAVKLSVSPSPDTVIRVFMAWQSSDSFVGLPSQKLITPQRNGFTVVEWGGTEIK